MRVPVEPAQEATMSSLWVYRGLPRLSKCEQIPKGVRSPLCPSGPSTHTICHLKERHTFVIKPLEHAFSKQMLASSL